MVVFCSEKSQMHDVSLYKPVTTPNSSSNVHPLRSQFELSSYERLNQCFRKVQSQAVSNSNALGCFCREKILRPEKLTMSSDVHQLNTRYQFDDFMKLTCSVCFLIGKAPFCGLLLECPWSPQKVECCPGNRAQFASRCYIFDKFNSSVISRRSNRCLTVIQLLF